MIMNAEDAVERRGQCLCGKVTVTAKRASNDVGACHCDMCRRWGGGPFMEINCGTDIEFDGEEDVAIYGSSDWAERGFCRNCGTHLFYRLKGSGEHMVPVGLFEIGDNLEFKSQVFIDEKPGYYEFANKTKDFTAAEIIAMFSAPDGA